MYTPCHIWVEKPVPVHVRPRPLAFSAPGARLHQAAAWNNRPLQVPVFELANLKPSAQYVKEHEPPKGSSTTRYYPADKEIVLARGKKNASIFDPIFPVPNCYQPLANNSRSIKSAENSKEILKECAPISRLFSNA